MNQPFPVNRRQGSEHGNHHIQGFLRTDPSSCLGNIGFKGDALNVIHDKIGGSILVKVIRYPRDIRLAHKFGQDTGLLFKTLLAVGKFLLAGRRPDNYLPVLQAGRQFTRHVFLYRHPGFKTLIPGQIGDAKAALAQDPSQKVSAF